MTDGPIRVYYNSACPVCKAGIEAQRGHMRKQDLRGNVEWVDIACNAQVLDRFGLDLETVRHSLHVHDGTKMHVGADAFIVLARTAPGQHWLAALFGNRFILPVSRFSYNRFANLLYWWNKKRGRW